MSLTCTHCNASNAPGSRFCAECGKPITAPVSPGACPKCKAANIPGARFCGECGTPLGAAPTPPVPPAPGPSAVPPVPPRPMTGSGPFPPAPATAGPAAIPPVPPRPATVVPPVPPAPGPSAVPPMPPALAPAPISTPTTATVSGALGIPAGETIRVAAVGDLYNNGGSVAVFASENHLALVGSGSAPKVERVEGLRHAIIGDYDGDGTNDLALFTESQVWVVRYSGTGSVPTAKVALEVVPEHLSRAPFTHDGRTVLMAANTKAITFYVLHPSRGLVEIASVPTPDIKP